MQQHTLTESRILSDKNVDLGVVYKLTGRIGYITPNAEMQSFNDTISKIETLYKSDLICFDVTELLRWDTLSLRVIFPRVVKANKELTAKGKPPIAFIGDMNSDVFDAAKERHDENGTPEIPWYSSLEEFLKKSNL